VTAVVREPAATPPPATILPRPGLRPEGGDPRRYREGAVGWGHDLAAFVPPDRAPTPVRITSVFHHVVGAWGMVQSHASIGVPNEGAVGRELTT